MTNFQTLGEMVCKDDDSKRDFFVESFILEATEAICEYMARKKINRKELAERMGKSRSQVTQMLSGRNITLRSLAHLVHALNMPPETILACWRTDNGVCDLIGHVASKGDSAKNLIKPDIPQWENANNHVVHRQALHRYEDIAQKVA